MIQQAGQHNTHEAARLKSRREWWLGIFFIFMVSVLWAFGSILAQHVANDIGFNQPFLFTYIASGAISTCLPAYFFLSLLGFVHNPPIRDEKAEDTTVYKELGESDGAGYTVGSSETDDEGGAVDEAIDHRLVSGDSSSALVPDSERGSGVVAPVSVFVSGVDQTRPAMKSHLFMLKVGASLSVVWFATQWSYIASLASTSVTSSTIIANSSVLFTYMFNVMAKTEQFNRVKTFGVTLALLGAVAVGLSDKESDGSNESLWGDAASLASAVGYAVYSMILAVQVPSDDDVSMMLVMGYMGGCSVVLFLPLLVVLGLAPGVRVLSGLTLHVVKLVVFKSFFDNLLSELLWARAIILTTPTVATVGCSMTIPIAFASDYILHGEVPKVLSVSGALLMVVGFCFVGGGDSSDGGAASGGDDSGGGAINGGSGGGAINGGSSGAVSGGGGAVSGGGGGGGSESAPVVECAVTRNRRRAGSDVPSACSSPQRNGQHDNRHIE